MTNNASKLSAFPSGDDAAMAQLLNNWTAANPKQPVTLLAAPYTAALIGTGASLQPIARGAFGPACLAIAKTLVRARLLSIAKVRRLPSCVDISALPSIVSSPKSADLTAIVGAISSHPGRARDITEATARAVWIQARGYCQFEGCGTDLSTHYVTGRRGYLGYFAHIIAASPDGPRGDDTLSPKLCNDPENIMLLCDQCHRLIDKIAPNDYEADALRCMRSENIAQTKQSLECLSYPSAVPIVIGNNISGQNAMFDRTRMREALLQRKLRPLGQEQRFFYKSGSLEQTSQANDWLHALPEIPGEVSRLRALLSGRGELSGTPEVLAVFALTNMTTFILAGRLLGEARTVRLFQYDRNASQWSWPPMPRPSPQDFEVTFYCPPPPNAGCEEALLLLYITASPPSVDLPPALYRDGSFQMPTARIVAKQSGPNAIASDAELKVCADKIADAVRTLVDSWRVHRIHVVPVAPATACISLGQKLQARHQPRVCIYEREAQPDSTLVFRPTLEITAHEAIILANGQRMPLQ